LPYVKGLMDIFIIFSYLLVLHLYARCLGHWSC
jgi:hypothetical protein